LGYNFASEAHGIFDHPVWLVLYKTEYLGTLLDRDYRMEQPWSSEFAFANHADDAIVSATSIPQRIIARWMSPSAAMRHNYSQAVVMPLPAQPESISLALIETR
jgi:hypothetical protein